MSDPSRASGSPRAEPRGDWTDQLRSRLASLSLTPEREAEIVEELSQHLDQRYEELRGGGESDTDAQRLAIAELLDHDALAHRMRSLEQAHATPPLTPGAPGRFIAGDLWHDLRYSVRMLRKRPGFAAAAILTLAFGIGATTAIFGIVNAVLINPLPYPGADSLVAIVHTVDGEDEPVFGEGIFLRYLENNRTFESLGAWSPYAGAATITGDGAPVEVRVLSVSRELLPTLGVRPALGRGFSSLDDTLGMPGAVMLTHAYWQDRFGGDPRVVERVLTINSRPHQVVGVMPPGFLFGGDRDIILPLRINRARPSPVWHILGVARLRPGVTLGQANADVARMIPIWSKPSAGTNSLFRNTKYGASLRPLKQEVVGDVGSTLWVLMGTIAIVLLMACANVANLLLVRADARRQEFAIRAALGANVTRMARALLVESLTLALLGGALGVGLAQIGLRALVAIGPANLPRLAEIAIDPIALGFAMVVSLLSGAVFGLIPIVRYARTRLASAVGAGGRGASLTRSRQRSQHALVAVQIALALVLLVSSGLMIRTFFALRSVEPGFTQPHNVQTFTLSIPPNEVAEPERVTRMQQQIQERLAAIPGVAAAAFTTRLPMDTSGGISFPVIPEDKVPDGRTPPSRQIRTVSTDLFSTLGTRLVVGRDFTSIDIANGREVAIITENLAREWWGEAATALGKRIREGNAGRWREIVGVSADIFDAGADQRPVETVFFPVRAGPPPAGEVASASRRVSFVVRSDRAGTENFLSQVREAVWSVNSNLPLAQVRTLGELYDRSMARTSFTLVLLVIAATMALLLGTFGIYGVLSYAVSQRRREIGIRLALGAQARAIQGLFVRQGLVLAAIGVAVGLAGAAGFTRVMQSVLFGIDPLDPVTFVAMPLVLTVVAALASYLPARHAMAVDPVETMRAE